MPFFFVPPIFFFAIKLFSRKVDFKIAEICEMADNSHPCLSYLWTEGERGTKSYARTASELTPPTGRGEEVKAKPTPPLPRTSTEERAGTKTSVEPQVEGAPTSTWVPKGGGQVLDPRAKTCAGEGEDNRD